MTKLVAYFVAGLFCFLVGLILVPTEGSQVPYFSGFFPTLGFAVWLGFHLRKSPWWWLGCLGLVLAPFMGVTVAIIFYNQDAIRESLKISN